MHRAPARALVALALTVLLAGCDDSPDARPTPLGPLGAEEFREARLAVDATGSELARLQLTFEGGRLREPLEVMFESREGEPVVGAVALPPDATYGVVAEGFDAEGRRTQVGKGELRVLAGETPQVELALAPEPGANRAFVRIGTYRLTASQSIISVRPRQSIELAIGMVDADGREQPIEKGVLSAGFPEWPREVRPLEIVYGGYKAYLAWIQQRGGMIGQLVACYPKVACVRVRLDDGTDPIKVSAGGHVSCVLRGTGNTRCWGPNGNGETGEDAQGVSQLAGFDFVDVSAGTSNHALGTHVCAAARTGAVYCWGRNVNGQLGNGTTAPATVSTPTPQLVTLPGSAKAVAAGQRHSCALMVDGTVYCWGEATMGQLGNGAYRTNTAGPGNITSPVLVNTSERFTSLSAGNAHTCGLNAIGEVFCWGRNVEKATGVGPAQSVQCNYQGLGGYWESCVPLPTLVQGVPTLAALEAGTFDSCGRSASNEGWCWGNSSTGNPAITLPTHVPQLVQGGVQWTHLSVGGGFKCGFDTAERGTCWGLNYGGQLGTGTATYPVSTPAPNGIANPTLFFRMDSGDDHACAIRRSDRRVLCWGIDNFMTTLGFAHPGVQFSATPQLVTVLY